MIRQSDPPLTRAQFERRLHLLAEAISRGRLSVAPHLTRSIDDIRAVRYLPNGRIDLLTVDGMVRVNALSMVALDGLPERAFEPDDSCDGGADSQNTGEDNAGLNGGETFANKRRR